MNRQYDEFDDFLSGDNAIREGGGILDSPGLKDFEGVQTEVVAEGAAATLSCQNCGSKRQVITTWPELVVLAENGPGVAPLLPTGWQFSPQHGTAYVGMRCPSCGQPGFEIHMTPEEAQGHVRAGVNGGLVPLANVQAIQQRMRQQRGGR